MEARMVAVDPIRIPPSRINVRGTSGVGKSRFSEELARRLALPYVELDALYHGPNWSEPTVEDFQARVCEVMDNALNGWVIDGSYDSKLGDIVTGAADTIVWLDLPLRITMIRLWRRTLYRVFHHVELWNGNRETWRDQFASRQSIFYWTVRAHFRHRREWPSRFGDDPRVVRLRSDGDVSRWLDEMYHRTGVTT